MKSLFVYADFDWLDAPQLVGELSYDSIRGGETYGFSFDRDWLASHGEILLSDDIRNFIGWQYTANLKYGNGNSNDGKRGRN